MKQRIYIDAHAFLGRSSYREDRIPFSAEDLIEEMRYYRVHASIVCSNSTKDYSFIKGNDEIIDLTFKNRRIFGVGTVIPGIQYEIPEGKAYLKKLKDSSIKAFKVYPHSLSHGFSPFFLEELAEYMSCNGLPLLVEISETYWGELRSVLQAFPDMNILLCNTDWSMNRFLFPLMDKFRNLFFEINANQANDILSTCKNNFGTDRVLFGTCYPYKVMGGLKALIEYADISDADKDNIASRNAIKLFGLNANEIDDYGDTEYGLDEISSKVDMGLPLKDELVIDAHAHLVDSKHVTVSYIPIIHSDEHNMIRKMDRLGIDKMIICPWEGLTTNGLAANETSIAAVNAYPGRIEAYAMCNPNYPDDLIKVISVFHKEKRFPGLKPYYPFNRYDLLGEKYKEWFEYADQNKLIMLVHTSVPGIVPKIEKLSCEYKNVAFLLAHSGASYETANENLELAQKRRNVYLEITYTSLTNGIIEYLVSSIGADRVIFGTDAPMRDPAPQLAWICYAKISVEEKRKILGLNIKGLLERCYQ